MTPVALEKGRRYRVTREGARLEGWKPCGPSAQTGATVRLDVGDEVEYLGWRYSGGSDGIDVHAFRLASREAEDAAYCFEFAPLHPERRTIFDTRPHPEFLERVEQGEACA